MVQPYAFFCRVAQVGDGAPGEKKSHGTQAASLGHLDQLGELLVQLTEGGTF